MTANMMNLRKHGRIIHGVFAMVLLIPFSAAQTQSSSRSSGDLKPAADAHAQQSTKPDTGSPAATTTAPVADDPGTDQIDADVRKLHVLAAELREEVGKTYKESLSVNVLKKAREIETLSKSLKERMDQKAAAARHR